MLIGAVADVHGNFDALRLAMERHRDVPEWLCVGDLASRAGTYPEPVSPLYWIKGNNENFDRVAAWQAGEPEPRHLHYIPNGTSTIVCHLRVAGLGGTFAPSWFAMPSAELPRGPRDDKRRHFVREEVEVCARMNGIDVFMTHEAPRPFILSGEPRPAGRRPPRYDAGKSAINDVLAAMQPRLHLYGHHHRFVDARREGVRSVCLDRIARSYLLIDVETLEFEVVATRGMEPGDQAYD